MAFKGTVNCDCKVNSEWSCSHKLRPNVGDLIEIKKALNCHWAVYIDDGDVGYLTAVRNRDENRSLFSLSSSSVVNEKVRSAT